MFVCPSISELRFYRCCHPCCCLEFSGEVQEYEYYYEEYEEEGLPPTDVDNEQQQQNHDNSNADSIKEFTTFV